MTQIIADLRARGFRIHVLPDGTYYVYGVRPAPLSEHALRALHASGAWREGGA